MGVYTLENENGVKVKVTDLGATIISIIVPDIDGREKDVVLGYDTMEQYEKGNCFFGCVVGRNANRIGGAKFQLDDICYTLEENDNGNNLHSGNNYFHTRIWNVESIEEEKITFTLVSPEGDQGYPGAVDLKLTYLLSKENELEIHYEGIPDKDTILNLTNHSYFNMAGHESGSVEEQAVWIDADYVTVVNENLTPTGEVLRVEGTPFDFRREKQIGEEIHSENSLLKLGGGYDHNWCLNNEKKFKTVASLYSKKTGIKMWVSTDLPGMQMYTANFLGMQEGKTGVVYGDRSGVCFETQYYPDAINHVEFEAPITRKNNRYQTKTVYKFDVEKKKG